jgi:hypothetical protein
MPGWLAELFGFVHRKWSVLHGLLGWPLVGEIEGRFLVTPPRLCTERFGESTHLPTVLEIYVSHDHQWPLDVGRLVDAVYFRHHEPIVFNVCFGCAKPSLLRGGDYANPDSHWFNVFFGYYEIDVRCSEWTRPFGFASSAEGDLTPVFDDLLRIGKSDWNYFSNYIYGVPLQECARHDQDPPEASHRIVNDCVEIGGKEYVEAEVDGLDVVSGYVSGKDGRSLRNNVCGFSPLWRAVFGRPKRSASQGASFPGTAMRMRFYARWERGPDADLGCDAYKTFIYGGAINLGYEGAIDNEAFLAAQMDAVREAMKTEDGAFAKRERPSRPAKWKAKIAEMQARAARETSKGRR